MNDPKNMQIFREVHSETADARAFLTSIFTRNYDLSDEIEAATPDLEHQAAFLWGEMVSFVRTRYGNYEAEEWWRDFCEYGTNTAELEMNE